MNFWLIVHEYSQCETKISGRWKKRSGAQNAEKRKRYADRKAGNAAIRER